jgi:hypothetical protein
MRVRPKQTHDSAAKVSLREIAILVFLLPGRAFLFLMYINTPGGLRKAMQGINHRSVPRLTWISS